MIKLFISDVDGTLLNENHVLPKENRDAILKMREHGISFVPASGRDYPMLLEALKDLNIKMKAICLNGAEFYNNQGELLASYPIDKKIVKQIHEICLKYEDVHLHYFTNHGRYIVGKQDTLENKLKEEFNYLFIGENLPDLDAFINDNKLLEITNTAKDLSEIEALDIIKMELIFETQDMKKIMEEELAKLNGILCSSSHLHNIEINAQEASKGAMALKVCELYGIDEKEAIVIGDSYNDISMLSSFTNSYAMGQAPQVVKDHANHVALSYKEHGVAKLIEEILEEQCCD